MIRRLASLTAIAAVASSLLGGNAHAATYTLPPAARTLSGCLDDSNQLSVLFLIDESSSLRGSDPEARRVDGIKAALTGLARIADTAPGGRRRHVEVAFQSFYGAVRPAAQDLRWHPATNATLDGLFGAVERYRARHFGQDTDYATALADARTVLSSRAAQLASGGGSPPCTALIWFTDGRYQLTDRVSSHNVLPTRLPYAPGVRVDRIGGGNRAVAAGRRYLCRRGGLMDGLAHDGVVTFTVALSARLRPEDGQFLRALTTGHSRGGTCGSTLSLDTGYYLSAADSARLLFAFSGLFTGAAKISPRPGETCVPVDCPAGYRSFTTVPGLSRFVMDASTDEPGVDVRLVGPDGGLRTLSPSGPSSLRLGGTALTQRWVSRSAVEIEGDFDAGASDWVGDWKFAFVDPTRTGTHKNARPYSRVQFFTGVLPRILGRPTLIRGQATTLKIDLAGARADSRLLASARLSGTVTDPATGHRRPLDITGPDASGVYEGRISLPVSTSAPYLNVDLVAGFSGVSGGTVAPSQRRFSLPTTLPPGGGFPLVSPLELRLATIKGDGSTTGTITIRGSGVSGGCVSIGRAALSTPNGKSRVRSRVAGAGAGGHCIRVGARERRVVAVRFSAHDAGVGRVKGFLPLRLHSDRFKGTPQLQIPTSFQVALKPNVARRWLIVGALTLLGALLPLLLLHALNMYAARFPPPRRIKALSQDARVVAGEGLRPPPGASNLKSHYEDDFSDLDGDRRPRELSVDGVQLKTVASGNLRDLFRGPYAVATARGAPIAGGGGGHRRTWRSGTAQEVPLSLAGTWLFYPTRASADEGAAPSPPPGTSSSLDDAESIFAVAPGPEPEAEPEQKPEWVDGRLVMFIAEGGDPDQGADLLRAAGEQIAADDRTFLRRPPVARAPAAHEPTEDASKRREGPLTRLFRRSDRQEAAPSPPDADYGSVDDLDVLSPDALLGPRPPATPEHEPDEDDRPIQ